MGSNPGYTEFFFKGNFDVAGANQQRCCLESGHQRLNNLDRTHLLLANGKIVQKIIWIDLMIMCKKPQWPSFFHLNEPLQ